MNVYAERETARRYDSARELPAETKGLWLEALKAAVPAQGVGRVLDLGCGTGRFTAALGEAFGCGAVGVGPSAAMLEVAASRPAPNVEWLSGSAENIPLGDASVGLVFMSQVFHHLARRREAIREIRRVLAPAGHLAVRNGTREQHAELAWLGCFP